MVKYFLHPLVVGSTIASAAVTRRSPLDVQLVHVNDTIITAVITNTGKKGYNLLHRNSVLDPAPSRKLHVTGHGMHSIPYLTVFHNTC